MIDINNDAFENCLELEGIIIPNSVKQIRIEQFKNCEKLKKICWKGKIYTYDDLKSYGKF